MKDEELIAEIQDQRSLMTAVATGGPRIQEVNDQYVQRRTRIAAELRKRRISDPNPHTDLWHWYETWSSGDLPTYKSRRVYLSGICDPLLASVESAPSPNRIAIFDVPTGWPRVDRGIEEIRFRLQQGENEEQFQAIGLLCREVLISAGQAVYDRQRHPSRDSTDPSDTDAKRMLDNYVGAELVGSHNEGVRRHAKAALSLANDLQHHRTADRRQAALCAEATVSVVNIVSIISGRRDSKGRQVGVTSSIVQTEGLAPHHVAALVAVAQEIGEPNDSVAAHRVRDVMAQDRYTKIATTLGLNALLEKELVFSCEREGYDDDYTAYGLTKHGMAWLSENQDKIPLRYEEKLGSDDDVPF